jgi:hypothetical protein
MPVATKRRFRRFAVNVPCFVRPSKYAGENEGQVPGETKDISRGGLCIVAKGGWTIGTEIECVIQLPFESASNEPIELQCQGRIVRIGPQDGTDERIEVGAAIERFTYVQLPKDSVKKSRRQAPPAGKSRLFEETNWNFANTAALADPPRRTHGD